MRVDGSAIAIFRYVIFPCIVCSMMFQSGQLPCSQQQGNTTSYQAKGMRSERTEAAVVQTIRPILGSVSSMLKPLHSVSGPSCQLLLHLTHPLARLLKQLHQQDDTQAVSLRWAQITRKDRTLAG